MVTMNERDGSPWRDWPFVLVVLVAIAISSVQGWQVRTTRHLSAQNRELVISTNRALCNFYFDLDRRKQGTQDFINAHPNGIPGISRADLDRSLASQQATLVSLSELKCSPPS
jgi:hypothetical protein